MNKLKGEKYKLLWKESPDFVRLASKLDCTIVPFAAVGGEQLRFSISLVPFFHQRVGDPLYPNYTF